jgi:SAM-dependent methyltransferase
MKPPFYRTVNNFLSWKLYKSNGWVFSDFGKNFYIHEYAEWRRFYLPSFPLKGLTVLDIGAGEGETARFFLEHGAAKIICIEPNRKSFQFLKLNAQQHNLDIYHKPFTLSDLSLPHNYMKMDIEGYEEELLTLPQRPKIPCVIEVHGLQLREKFIRAGYISKYKSVDPHYGWVSYAYNESSAR